MHQKDLGTVYSSFRLSREVAAQVLVKAGAGLVFWFSRKKKKASKQDVGSWGAGYMYFP